MKSLLIPGIGTFRFATGLIWFIHGFFVSTRFSTNLVRSASRVLIRSGLVLLHSARLLLSRSASVLLI